LHALANDTYGHPSGDRVICHVTDICRQMSREIDVVARLGGEEFAVFLPGSDALHRNHGQHHQRVLPATGSASSPKPDPRDQNRPEGA